ncbi:hypothetical protein BGX27_004798 [Mortierella sp. AM989]|nr:hypothetical protein BGX27_004798 [Mortierella sp. AM989]
MVFMVHTAPTGQGQGRHLRPGVNYFDDTVAPPGPLISNWNYQKRLTPEDQDRREQKRQQRQPAFHQFSEKFVSTDCVPILTLTLVHLDKVRGFLHDCFKTKASFEFLEPILNPLVEVLDMHKNCTFPVEYVSKEDNDASSAQIKLSGSKKGRGDYEIIEKAEWTEENEPELLFKFRLRYLEKNLGVFQHVLKIAPEPIRQELEVIGFVQETKVLQEHASRLTVARMRSISMAMDPAQAALCGLVNVTRDASSKPSGEQPLNEEAVDPSSSSPQDKFMWSNEAMMQMVKAVTKGHREDLELAMLF